MWESVIRTFPEIFLWNFLENKQFFKKKIKNSNKLETVEKKYLKQKNNNLK